MAAKDRVHQREPKKTPAVVPSIPDLGKLKMPRKNNAAAAKEIASGNRLWDRRHVAAAETKKSLRTSEVREARRAFNRLEKPVRNAMLKYTPSWHWDDTKKQFRVDAEKVTQFQAEEMAEAISTVLNDAAPTQLRIRGVDAHQLGNLRAVTHPKHRLLGV